MYADGCRTEIQRGARSRQILRFAHAASRTTIDEVAIEEPLEIRIVQQADGIGQETPISITMRTPGHDAELATGFLVCEGVITNPEDIERVRLCAGGNEIRVTLKPTVTLDTKKLARHFYTSSSCGVCGKTAIKAVNVQVRGQLNPALPIVTPKLIKSLSQSLRSAQRVFDRTGGLHASGLFTTTGELIRMHEDVGRHNALDKLIGAQWFEDESVFAESVLMLSGRVSFELVQKSLTAGIPIVAAVGAPSSLAVELADKYDLTLIGFVRNQRFNVYSGFKRVHTRGEPCPR